MSVHKFYVLADAIAYNVKSDKLLSQNEKEYLLKKLEKGTISTKDIIKYGKDPEEPIEEQYLTKKIQEHYYDNGDDDDDYDRMQEEQRQEEEAKQKDKEYWEELDEACFERAWEDYENSR